MTTFQYIQTDIPEGMTLTAWRASHATPRRSFIARLLGFPR